jgi:YidC/Oxa1 family membrane protein insertase
MLRLPDFSRLLDAPVGVAYHVVSTLATWLAPVPGGLATAVAIVAFTAAVRLLLLPLSYYVVRGENSRARLLPRFQEVQRRYARQPDRLRRELGALQQAEGTGIYAGCLPLLLQLPFFSVMYRMFRSRDVYGKPNTLLTHHLLSAPLSSHWLTGAGPFSLQGVVFAGLLALLGVVAWFSARMARHQAGQGQAGQGQAGQGQAGQGRTGRDLDVKRTARVARPVAQTGGKPADRPAGLPGSLTRLLPYSTLLVAAVMPLAAGLYLLTTTTWTVLERTALRRRLIAGAGG